MRIFNNGYFALGIGAEELAKGLKPKGEIARNEKFLERLTGGYIRQGQLQSSDLLDRTALDFSAEISEVFTFPWPQLLVLTNHILLCGPENIYKLEEDVWTQQISASLSGGLWTCVDFEDYLYLSNGAVAIIRSIAGAWSETTELPKALALCNFNGQVFAGSVEA